MRLGARRCNAYITVDVAQDRNLMVPAPYPTHLDPCSLTLRVSEATSVGAKSQWGRYNSLGGGAKGEPLTL